MRDVSNDGRDYDVGFRKPPKEHRWEKGQSGNPTGKRKMRKPGFAGDLSKALAEIVPASIDGKPVTLTAKELIAIQLVDQAAKGSRRALKRLLLMLEHLEDMGEIEPVVVDISADEAGVI